MIEPGHPAAPIAAQPTPPPYAPGIPGVSADPAAAPAPSKAKKVLRVAGPVVIGGVITASWAGFGGGAPEVGDCVTADGADSFLVVGCDSADAQHRVIGIEEAELSYDDYMADDTLCAAHATTMIVLWVGETGSDGTVLCAEAV